MPGERLNTEDAVMATTKKTTSDQSAPVEASAFEEDWTCDYCHVQLRAVKQMILNDTPHEVRQCPNDEAHTKTVLA